MNPRNPIDPAIPVAPQLRVRYRMPRIGFAFLVDHISELIGCRGVFKGCSKSGLAVRLDAVLQVRVSTATGSGDMATCKEPQCVWDLGFYGVVGRQIQVQGS